MDIDLMKCHFCPWEGPAADLVAHPLLDFAACPDCWADGFESEPRRKLGPLQEAVLADELRRAARARVKKRLACLDDAEWAAEEKLQRAKAAHEASEVRLKTTVEGAAQLGFGFLRGEFRVAGPAARRKK